MNNLVAYGGYLAVAIILLAAAVLSRKSSVLSDRYSVALSYFRLFMVTGATTQFLVFFVGVTGQTELTDYAWAISWLGYVLFLAGLNIAVGRNVSVVEQVFLSLTVLVPPLCVYFGLPSQYGVHVLDVLYLVLLAEIFIALNARLIREKRAAGLLRMATLSLVLPVAGRSLLVLFWPDLEEIAHAIWTILNATLALALTTIVLLLLNWGLMSVLRDESLTDVLTGLQNRRSLEAWYPQMQSLSDRNNSQIGFLVCDLDFFKQVNDNYGHDKGDAVLRGFAEILRKSTRGSDFVARIGGEEFVVVMPMADQDAVEVLTERIRSLTASVPFHVDNLELPVTTSIGAGLFPGGTNLVRAFEEADANLYMAKQGGRNRVEFRQYTDKDTADPEISPAWTG